MLFAKVLRYELRNYSNLALRNHVNLVLRNVGVQSYHVIYNVIILIPKFDSRVWRSTEILYYYEMITLWLRNDSNFDSIKDIVF